MDRSTTKNSRFVYFIAAIAGMGGLLFGFDTGIIADSAWQITREFKLTSWQWSITVSSTVLGAFLSSLFCGYLADFFGRRKTLIISSYFFIFGTIISAFSQGFISLVVGRFVLGSCIGIASFTSPLFISETSPINIRGKLVLFNNVAITGGEAISFLVGYYLHGVGNFSWRIMFLIGIIPPIVLLIGLKFMPLSPRWVAVNYGIEQSRKILEKIRCGNKELIDEEINEITKNLKKKVNIRFKSLFQKPIKKVIILGVMLGILQQFSGINVIMYYGPFVFRDAGFSQEISLFSTFIMGAVNTLFTVLALFTVDFLGRRPLLVIGSLLSSLALSILAIQEYYPNISPWIAFFSIFFYIISFSMSLGCIFWLVISELYPTNIRGTAMSFVTAVQWLTNFFVSLSFLPLFNNIGGGSTMLIFSTFSFFAAIFGFFYLPETKGVSLERIESNLKQGKPLRRLGI